jgi:hypothetical protein
MGARLPTDPKEVKELIALYKELTKVGSGVVDIDDKKYKKLSDMILMVKQQADGYKALVEAKEEDLELLTKGSRLHTAALDDLENLKLSHEQLARAGVLSYEKITKLAKELKKASTGSSAAAKEARKDLAALDAAIEENTIKTQFGITARDLAIASLGTSSKEILANLKTSFNSYATMMDTGLTKYTATIGLYSKALELAHVSALGPFKQIGEDGQETLEAFDGIMRGIGLTGEDVGSALQDITNNISIMRHGVHSIGDREIISRTANLVAGMKKLGVGTKTTTTGIDLFTRALKQTPAMALNSMLRLDGLANSLHINVNQAIQDYNSLAPTLVAYGERSIDVFAGMEAQAQATGISLANLDKFAQKFDTFEGAATAAGKLNAILGGTHLSMMELVHADPAEKFELIKQAVADAGVAFEDMDRRQKMVIAGALSMDVESAARLFGSEEDFQMAGEAMDTTATKQDEMTERIKKATTATDLLKLKFSELADPMRDYENLIRRVSTKLGEAPVKLAQDMQKAMMGFGASAQSAGEAVIGSSGVIIDGVSKKIEQVKGLIPGSGVLKDLGILGLILLGETGGELTKDQIEKIQKRVEDIQKDAARGLLPSARNTYDPNRVLLASSPLTPTSPAVMSPQNLAAPVIPKLESPALAAGRSPGPTSPSLLDETLQPPSIAGATPALGPQTVQLIVDGKKLGEVAIKHGLTGPVLARMHS